MGENVTPLRPGDQDMAARLHRKHGTTPAQLKGMVLELFLWMHDQGVNTVEIRRDGKRANFIIDGKPHT